MTVAELRKKLEDYPDDAIICVEDRYDTYPATGLNWKIRSLLCHTPKGKAGEEIQILLLD